MMRSRSPILFLIRLTLILSAAFFVYDIVHAGKDANTLVNTPAGAAIRSSLQRPTSSAASQESRNQSSSLPGYASDNPLSITPQTVVDRATIALAVSGYSTNAYAERGLTNAPDNVAQTHHSLSAVRNMAALSANDPMLLTAVDSTRALALDMVTWKSEPFGPTMLLPWALDSADRQTRISLMTMNVGPSFGDTTANV